MELQFKPVPPDKYRMNIAVPDEDHRYYVWKINGVWHSAAYRRSGTTWAPGTIVTHRTMDKAMRQCDKEHSLDERS